MTNECDGGRNVMCSKCCGILEHRCDCPTRYIRFCECATPKPIEIVEEEEGDVCAELNE